MSKVMKTCLGVLVCLTTFVGCSGGGSGEALFGAAAQPAEPVTAGPPLATLGMRPVAGQQATCAGPQHKTFTIDVLETSVELGSDTTLDEAWTYDGGIPGPTLEVCEGDRVTLVVNNKGTTAHGLDTHAFKIDAAKYGPVGPGETLTIDTVVDTMGVYMYHCASGPVTDQHIKSGLHGAMIVYPRDVTLRPAHEIVVVQSAIYGEKGADGVIPGTDPNRTFRNEPTLMMFNGRVEHQPVGVVPGELVRVYFVNVGPGMSAAHPIGTAFERVYDGTEPILNVQTHAVPAGAGAMLEFRIPEPGAYLFVDHDKLAYLPLGFVVVFVGQPTT